MDEIADAVAIKRLRSPATPLLKHQCGVENVFGTTGPGGAPAGTLANAMKSHGVRKRGIANKTVTQENLLEKPCAKTREDGRMPTNPCPPANHLPNKFLDIYRRPHR